MPVELYIESEATNQWSAPTWIPLPPSSDWRHALGIGKQRSEADEANLASPNATVLIARPTSDSTRPKDPDLVLDVPLRLRWQQ
jgi:hypothetical protein